MARKNKVVPANIPVEEPSPSYASAPQTATDPDTVTTTSSPPEQPTAGRSRTPDPHPYGRIDLGDGHFMRLWRGDREAEMAITFDVKPDDKYLDLLRDARFKWDNEVRAWVLPLDAGEKWKAVMDAERTFHRVGDTIRADKGLPVVRGVA